MKGDFSRLTGLKAKRKHYNAVLKQQGRVQLDSDWNELVSIIAHQRKTRTIDTIGTCGAPIHNSGFQILHPGNGLQNLLITTGRFYAGGLLCETSPSSKLPVHDIKPGGTMSVDDVRIDGVLLESGQWVQLITDEHPEGIIGKLTSVTAGKLKINQNLAAFVGDHHAYLRRLILFSEQADFPQAKNYRPKVGQTDLCYLDVWERHVTPIEDPDLREVALGGPDTDTRSRIVAQVKILPEVGAVNCSDEIPKWNELIKAPNGRLTTRLKTPNDPIDPCQLGESGGYHGLENHLYRVEIHEIKAGKAYFKWSRDNAAFAYPIKEFFNEAGVVKKISLQQNGKDEILKIKRLDWIEVSGEATDLDVENAGTLTQVLDVDGNILILKDDVSAHMNGGSPKIRRWETSNQRPNVTTKIVTGTGFQLEDGIELEFSGTEFRVGDYWVFSARTLTGEIELLTKEAPLGIKHHYCKLALITGTGDRNVDIEDCRPEFPPLTELPTGDGGCCTVTVGENEDYQDIQLAIDSLKGGPGEVCIKPGIYRIDKPIRIRGNDIIVRACEGTPIIVNTNIERDGKVFIVQNSMDIHIEGLWCFSFGASRVVEVENTLFFKLNDCFLVAAGNKDAAGVLSFLGLTVETEVYDNWILGITGIRYDEAVEQLLKLHLNARVEKNIIFAFDHAICQHQEISILGLDIKENFLLGIGLDLISKASFPEKLFKEAERSKMFSDSEIKKAKAERAYGIRFDEKNSRNKDSYSDLNKVMKMSSAKAKAEANLKEEKMEVEAGVQVTTAPRIRQSAVALGGIVADANFNDNILMGNIGLSIFQAFEFSIDSNLILARQGGIELGVFEGISIRNNYITAGQYAIGCVGKLFVSLTISDNRLISRSHGILFSMVGLLKSQFAFNIQIEKNIIEAIAVGIGVVNSEILLWDFTVVDNTIKSCRRAGILLDASGVEIQELIGRTVSLQRVIQRNSISVSGTGIDTNLHGCKILDNDINFELEANQEASLSRGIIIRVSNCVVANNSIQANPDIERNIFPFGGIYLDLGYNMIKEVDQQIQLRHNKILGGIRNGIEIATNFSGLVIEGNQILNMGGNGIAVQNQVEYVNNLSIINNQIRNCHQLVTNQNRLWWKYAGIVLTKTRKTQIRGNVICDNGLNADSGLPGAGFSSLDLGAFYAEEIQELTISDNQFLNNGAADRINNQAVIHVPITRIFLLANNVNSDVQITNNICKSNQSPSLILGNYALVNLAAGQVGYAYDQRMVISNNHFESEKEGLIVNLQVGQFIFSTNYIKAGASFGDLVWPAVSLGYGASVMANGNVTSAPILGAGLNQQIVNTLQF